VFWEKPIKIILVCFLNVFRPETVELIMIDYFPGEFSIQDRAKHWVKSFSSFDKMETKALEQILLQKQRFVFTRIAFTDVFFQDCIVI
jgi:sister chromatid cohesion protein PDS5